jgi:hypothetical protein
MSMIYQVWWGRRSLSETAWLWGVVVSVLLIDCPYLLSLEYIAGHFFRGACDAVLVPLGGFYFYALLALPIKAWIAVGLWRSRTALAGLPARAFKAAIIFATVVLLPIAVFGIANLPRLQQFCGNFTAAVKG